MVTVVWWSHGGLFGVFVSPGDLLAVARWALGLLAVSSVIFRQGCGSSGPSKLVFSSIDAVRGMLLQHCGLQLQI